MSVSSKVFKVTRSILRDNELPAESLQRIPVGSDVSLSTTMINTLAHMKHAGTIVIPKYGFTIKDRWLYCDKNQTTCSKMLWKILEEVPWIIGLSVGLLDDFKEKICTFQLGIVNKNKKLGSCLKHLVIYEKIKEYEKGYWPTLISIIKDNVDSLVSFCADSFVLSSVVFSSLQYLKIRISCISTYYLSSFPKLMILDIPKEAITFPYLFSDINNGISISTIVSVSYYAWAFATHNLKRHRAKVYTFVKFTPIVGRDVARMLSRMIEAMPATEWKLREEDIPEKHRQSGVIKHIPDVMDTESALLLDQYKEYKKIERDSRMDNAALESKQKKLKQLEREIVDLTRTVGDYKPLLETWKIQSELSIQQFLNQ